MIRKGYAEIREGQIHYAEEGSARPLLLLSRSPRSWTYYRHLMPLLARQHRAVAVDMLNFGNSVSAPPEYEIADYADCMVRFMDALGIGQFDLWGTFTGSTIAAEMAIHHPDRVRRLVLMGVPMFRSSDERQRHLDVAKGFARFIPDATGRFLTDIWKWVSAKAQFAQNAFDGTLAVDSVADGLRAGPSYVHMIMNSYRYDSVSRLPHIKTQTLVIGLTGESVFWFIRGDRAREVQSLIPQSELFMLDGQGAHEEVTTARAHELAQVVLPFLGR